MITDQYIVYGGQYTRTGLVLMVLDYAQLNYRVELLDLAAGEHKSPDFLKLNPAGFVPAMQLPGGEVMHETPAIMLYLAETHGLAELLPNPGASDRAQFLTGLFFCTNDIQPEIKRYYFPARYAESEDAAPAIHAQALAMLMERFGVLERRLLDHKFYLGDRFSMVDLIIAFWATSVFPRAQFVDACPALGRHAERVGLRSRVFASHISDHSVASERYWRERLPHQHRIEEEH